jgi:DNA-binding response OmpR family regulator
MDLSMPGMDGWEATRRLKADPLTNHIVIIAFTAHAFPPEQATARAAGCDAVIAKPFDLAILADALHRVISTGLATFDANGIAAKAAPRKPSSKTIRAEKQEAASPPKRQNEPNHDGDE